MRISDWSSDVCSSDLDERAPKGSRFPPARISCVGPKPHEERDGSAEQRRRQRRFLDRGHHVECRHRHVPHEQDRERLPNLDNDLPKTWPRAHNHINYALNRLTIVIRSACKSEENPSEIPSLMRISYAAFCLKNKTTSH